MTLGPVAFQGSSPGLLAWSNTQGYSDLTYDASPITGTRSHFPASPGIEIRVLA